MRLSGLMLLGVSAALLMAPCGEAMAASATLDSSPGAKFQISSDCDDDDCTGYEDDEEENEEESEQNEENEEPAESEESE